MKDWARFSRFLLAGALNTGLTYLIYLGLLLLVPYPWAYSLAYAAGIVIGYLMNALWVFGSKPSARTAAGYPLGYAANYLLGLTLVWLLVERGRVPREVAPLLVLVVTTPAMYLINRFLFRHGATNV